RGGRGRDSSRVASRPNRKEDRTWTYTPKLRRQVQISTFKRWEGTERGKIDAWRALLWKARHAKVCACLADGAFRFWLWLYNHNHVLTTRERRILAPAVQTMPVSSEQHWQMQLGSNLV